MFSTKDRSFIFTNSDNEKSYLNLKSVIEYFENQKEIESLTTDTASLEKYAREKHLMKKDNEDIYIIVEEE